MEDNAECPSESGSTTSKVMATSVRAGHSAAYETAFFENSRPSPGALENRVLHHASPWLSLDLDGSKIAEGESASMTDCTRTIFMSTCYHTVCQDNVTDMVHKCRYISAAVMKNFPYQ
ncbi:hypothetical protein J6590_038565 [Homalodisca vitripennis]|nr:hypothetical protein J6590_038565 [Homalodisca vitripennis]